MYFYVFYDLLYSMFIVNPCRAWDRVYREFTKIPGNKVFKLKHLFCKFKNFKKEVNHLF